MKYVTPAYGTRISRYTRHQQYTARSALDSNLRRCVCILCALASAWAHTITRLPYNSNLSDCLPFGGGPCAPPPPRRKLSRHAQLFKSYRYMHTPRERERPLMTPLYCTLARARGHRRLGVLSPHLAYSTHKSINIQISAIKTRRESSFFSAAARGEQPRPTTRIIYYYYYY